MAFSAVKCNLKLYTSMYGSRDCSTVSATGEFGAGWQWAVQDEAAKLESDWLDVEAQSVASHSTSYSNYASEGTCNLLYVP